MRGLAKWPSSTANILDPAETIELTGTLNAPSLKGVSTDFSWTLDTPTGSAATLSSTLGETTLFTTDVRGIYRVRLLNRFQTYSLPQLRAHAKWWMARDPEVWQLITVEIARKTYGEY